MSQTLLSLIASLVVIIENKILKSLSHRSIENCTVKSLKKDFDNFDRREVHRHESNIDAQCICIHNFFPKCSPQDLELIETIWNLNKDWEGLWASWKDGKFTELQTDTMETQCVSIFKKLNKYSRELKVSLVYVKQNLHTCICIKVV